MIERIHTTPKIFLIILAIAACSILFKTKIPNEGHVNVKNKAQSKAKHLKAMFNPSILLTSFFRPKIQKKSKQEVKETKKHRIAIIIPYISSNNLNNLPSYFDAFASSTLGSSSLVDFLIFHDGIDPTLLPTTYPNIKFINLQSKETLITLLLKVIPPERHSKKIKSILKIILQKYPYILVEFKPAYGHIFEEYIGDYTHWGYSDLDIVFGDLERWITEQELEEYDIVTYGYGDQYRVYLRGQFTFHKNTLKTKYLYNSCTYLTSMDVRFNAIESGQKEFKLESAEGCYSQAVLQNYDLNIKYAVKAMNDLSIENQEGADTKTVHSHGVYLAFANSTIVYKSGKDYSDPKPIKWYEHNNNYLNRNVPLQQEVGIKIPIKTSRDENIKCMYWAPKEYQTDLCIEDDVDSTNTVFYLQGKLYKQKYDMDSFDNIVSFPFFHFQEWKRRYRYNQLSAFRMERRFLDGIVMTKEGALPLYKASKHAVSTLDQSIYEFMSSLSYQLPSTIYCLVSSKNGDCDHAITWQDPTINFLFKGSTWMHNDDILQSSNDVSLILTLSLSSAQVSNDSVLNGFLSLINKNIRSWGMQPFILLLHISEATAEIQTKLHDYFHRNTDKYHPSSLIVVIYSNVDSVSRNALLNMAQNAARTRFILIGLELERGMVISRESSFFAKRAVLIHGENTGLVFYIPQIASKEFFGTYTDGTFSVSDILEERKVRSNLFTVDIQSFDCKSCSDTFEKSNLNDNIHESIMDLWWQITSNEVNGESIDVTNLSMQYLNIQKIVLQLSQSENQKHLYSFDTHPILLKDKIAPSKNLLPTIDLIPYIEEFGGRRCYNAIHLIQLLLLGYKFQLLPGAIAMSYPSSREKVCSVDGENDGTSRCDGCFMLDDNGIVDDVWKDELVRVAKTAALWNDYD